MIRNLIFDCGQVLIRYVPEEIVRAFVKDEKAVRRISQVLFDRLYWDRLDDGTVSDEEVKASVSARLPAELCEGAMAAYDGWFCACPVISGMPELLRAAKERGYRLYLLSNISCGFAEGYSTVPALNALLSHFDGLVFSGPLHCVKPNPEIYRHLLQTYDLVPRESLFIDDSQKNLDGAAAFGIKTYLFDGNVSALRSFLFP
ncbi:MAG: HAD family phosphatase [Clostridia bacterium]|nr:HAD family phosphatase [Clostridia bacterium]